MLPTEQYLSNRKRFPRLYNINTRGDGRIRDGLIYKPERRSRVWVTVENSPIRSSVYIRLCKHKREKQNSLFRLLIKREILTNREASSTRSLFAQSLLVLQ